MGVLVEGEDSARAVTDTARADFVRLAAVLSGGSARLETLDGGLDEAGTFIEERSIEHPIGRDRTRLGRLLLTGPDAQAEVIAILVRRIGATLLEHTVNLDIAEQATDIARAATRRFEALFDGLPVACYACDVEGGLMEWNQAAEEMWGGAIALAWGQEAAPIVDPDHPETEREIVARVLAGEIVRDEEREVRLPSGETRWHSASSFPLRDGGGEIVGVIGARLDIDRRKRAMKGLIQRETDFYARLDAKDREIAELRASIARLRPDGPA